MADPFEATISTPVGHVHVTGSADAVRTVSLGDDAPVVTRPGTPVLDACVSELERYFEGKLQRFTVPLEPEGTDFQQRVWKELLRIPFGETVSYLDVAKALGDPGAVRAVGAANGRNPIAILVPCHRVIGADGKLAGYAGGIARKTWLLRHEQRARTAGAALVADRRHEHGGRPGPDLWRGRRS